ncbi:MAG: phosphoenolpyruvate synthase, partial [Candidatus Komeilibacteria bacterium]|nr:phosphoenolpyruvate synthase [Candidatus Komeilibacteria bacterium]
MIKLFASLTNRVNRDQRNVLWFSELTNQDVGLVGGKNASLGEMYAKLTKYGVRIPNGFAVTAHAYRQYLDYNDMDEKIRKALRGLRTHDIADLSARGKKVRDIIMKGEFSPELKSDIISAYGKLSKKSKRTNIDVAVRSSATAEDLPSASFAGQQETYLNIVGEKNLLEAVKMCMASLFTDRAISYRQDRGFDHFQIALSVTVQVMVRSDQAGSGVMFSIDTESGFENVVVINAGWGLGELVVKGQITPDEYHVFKTALDKKFKGKVMKPIIGKEAGAQEIKMVYDTGKKSPVKLIKTSAHEKRSYVLTNEEILQLAHWAVRIENHYGRPMDMEWAKDGRTGKLFIVQARPETVESQENKNVLVEYKLTQKGNILSSGAAVGSKIGQGQAQIIKNVSEIIEFKAGNVLVTEMTDPDWEPIMKKAAAIVTNSGGRTCHAAIVSRELGIPCIVGTKTATEDIKDG